MHEIFAEYMADEIPCYEIADREEFSYKTGGFYTVNSCLCGKKYKNQRVGWGEE